MSFRHILGAGAGAGSSQAAAAHQQSTVPEGGGNCGSVQSAVWPADVDDLSFQGFGLNLASDRDVKL